VAQLLTDGNGTLAIVSWRVAAHVSRATLADEEERVLRAAALIAR
jgi:hypothetical protein